MWSRCVFIAILFIILIPGALAQNQEKVILKHADRLEIDNKKNIYELIGNVEIVQGAVTLNADRMVWSRNDGIVRGYNNIRIRDADQGSTVTGGYLEYHSATQFALIANGPRVERRDPTGSGLDMIITGERLEAYMQDNRFKAIGNVVVEQKDVVITGDVAVYYADKEEAVIVGDPEVRRGESTSIRSDIMTLLVKKNQVILRGISDSPIGLGSSSVGEGRTEGEERKMSIGMRPQLSNN
ncbi:MAG: LptA/OstA family protein [bacterium]